MQPKTEYHHQIPHSKNPSDYEWIWIRAKKPPSKGIYLICDPIECPNVVLAEWDGEKWDKFGDPYPYKTTAWAYPIIIRLKN